MTQTASEIIPSTRRLEREIQRIQPGDGNRRQQDGDTIRHPLPGRAGVLSLMELGQEARKAPSGFQKSGLPVCFGNFRFVAVVAGQ